MDVCRVEKWEPGEEAEADAGSRSRLGGVGVGAEPWPARGKNP
jgi:hypothetical protein